MSLKPPQADAQGKGKQGGEGPQRLYLWGACPPRWQLDVFQGWKLLTGLFLSSTFIWLASLLSGWVFSPSLCLFTFLSNTLMSGSTLLMMKSKCLLVRASRKWNKTKQKNWTQTVKVTLGGRGPQTVGCESRKTPSALPVSLQPPHPGRPLHP